MRSAYCVLQEMPVGSIPAGEELNRFLDLFELKWIIDTTNQE